MYETVKNVKTGEKRNRETYSNVEMCLLSVLLLSFGWSYMTKDSIRGKHTKVYQNLHFKCYIESYNFLEKWL